MDVVLFFQSTLRKSWREKLAARFHGVSESLSKDKKDKADKSAKKSR